MTHNEKWIIDTDPGVDDYCAISFAINYLKENLVLLSIENGNVGIKNCTINCKKVCVMNNKNYPIVKGDKLNLSAVSFECQSYIHGKDGLYDLDEFLDLEKEFDNSYEIQAYSAVEIVETCYKHDNINILAIGPLTNLALAFMLDNNIANRINRLVIMGGSYKSIGNSFTSVEFNFGFDVIAANVVMTNFKRIELYCWEPALLYRIGPEELIKGKNEKIYSLIYQCLSKRKAILKLNCILADYGAALVAFHPESAVKYRTCYAKVIVDSTYNVANGLLMVSKHPITKNQNLIKIYEELDREVYLDYFNYYTLGNIY